MSLSAAAVEPTVPEVEVPKNDMVLVSQLVIDVKMWEEK